MTNLTDPCIVPGSTRKMRKGRGEPPATGNGKK